MLLSLELVEVVALVLAFVLVVSSISAAKKKRDVEETETEAERQATWAPSWVTSACNGVKAHEEVGNVNKK